MQRIHVPYWPLLVIPYVLYAIGAPLNLLVVAANGNQMPVFWPGGCATFRADAMHVCMTPASHLKFLADWIVLGNKMVASIGDLFLLASQYVSGFVSYVWMALIIHDYTQSRNQKY